LLFGTGTNNKNMTAKNQAIQYTEYRPWAVKIPLLCNQSVGVLRRVVQCSLLYARRSVASSTVINSDKTILPTSWHTSLAHRPPIPPSALLLAVYGNHCSNWKIFNQFLDKCHNPDKGTLLLPKLVKSATPHSQKCQMSVYALYANVGKINSTKILKNEP